MMTTIMQDVNSMAATAVDPVLKRNSAKHANVWIPTTNPVKAVAFPNTKEMVFAMMTITTQDVNSMVATAVDPVLKRNSAKNANVWIPSTNPAKAAAVLRSKETAIV